MFLTPDWPAPVHIKAVSTTREGGISLPPYQGLNLGAHVGDQSEHVALNREALRQALDLARSPIWLNQIHSNRVLTLTAPTSALPDADGSYTQTPGVACTVMTADCLPVLLCDQDGTQVAAVHAGWRGLADGILEAALAKFTGPGETILAWLGPAIGPSAFEVGGEVRAQFMAVMPEAEAAFQPRGEKWLADLYLLARQRLARAGVHQIFGGDQCTYSQPEQYFSYRRDGITGRQASLIWIEPS
ncbi:peptidoglycan editing factor PgeF [Photobacterium sp. TY1-4]|uniref:peptidoglycan editing factor PgeF n=1 Tax=Photobacterium sp. TY1-4 TaxID=2899122 RepID=UPI0021C14D4C|nr:peptidoglycan editing factor PgeF [Photobacterium sp. TY1-4]UXI01798.1 peptidoglycan editing factor PgeF [Photobacterium sp. TY1-4]